MGTKNFRGDIHRSSETIDFPKEEEFVLKFWKDEQVFQNCVKLSKGKQNYKFYDGPPFATGLPHYGHILAGTIKDIVTRYAYQQGYNVDRRFGWDCHGLPVEYEIDKTLNIQGPDDVAKMGIAAYNMECRKIVMRYADEWEKIVLRMGRWIDFKNDYKTLYPTFMESVWWVFKQIYEKGLVYQGVKVMAYSTACTTPLSNFESGQNYKEVVDPSIVCAFEILHKANTYLLAWTTTPWTLTSNFALVVNPNMIYVKVEDTKTGRYYILAESRVEFVYKKNDEFKVLQKFEGITLKDLQYKPIFSYFEHRGKEVNAFRVLTDTYVAEDSGTGIVHTAPYFGIEDYRVSLAAGIITKSSAMICPIDDSGRFTEEVPDFKGQYFKDADKNIVRFIKSKGNLVCASYIKHSYPFCWRSDTPLMYKAVPSWFIRVEHMSENLLACSSQTYWVPDFVKEKRFGNWLKEARDWAISRNRYWGTPIPIWTSMNGDETICIGSIEELEKLSATKITDLHRENVDNIEIPSAYPGRAPLRRIEAVFDCWFESGSMPFAQNHFPFENEKDIASNFPADFIAEGIDQTRGWFYTLLVISTALFNKPPFKNLIANGLVLAFDGQKMSKRKKNYPDPMEVVRKYGADALRLYLINSPVVRAENLRFKEEGVRDIIKDVFLPWYNAYRFLLQNVARIEKAGLSAYTFDGKQILEHFEHSSIIDVWILSLKESLIDFVATEMKAYRLYTVVPGLTRFIDQLTNWYVRLNRRRIKGEMGYEESIQSLETLHDVLLSMVKIMAPFTPFLSEYIFQRISLLHSNGSMKTDSVHYKMMPSAKQHFIRRDVELAVSRMQSVVELGRVMRDRRGLPVKYPVNEIIVIHGDQNYLSDIGSLQDFIIGELNVRKLTLSTNKDKYGITLRAEPDHKSLGQRLKGDFKIVMDKIKALSDAEIQKHLSVGYLQILQHRVNVEEIRIMYCISEHIGSHYEVHSDNDVLVLMDVTPSQDLMKEGLAREIINRIQKLKKKAKLIPTDEVTIYYGLNEHTHLLRSVVLTYGNFIQSTVKSNFKPYSMGSLNKKEIAFESLELKGNKLDISICCNKEHVVPIIPWINVVLADDLQPRYNKTREGTLLVKDPSQRTASLLEIKHEVQIMFGLYSINFFLQTRDGSTLKNISSDLYGGVIIVSKNCYSKDFKQTLDKPFSDFLNCSFGGRNYTVLNENTVVPATHTNSTWCTILKRVYPRADLREVMFM